MKLYDSKKELMYIVNESEISIEHENRSIGTCPIIQRGIESGVDYINFRGPNSVIEAIEIGKEQIIHIRYISDEESPSGISILESSLDLY